MIAPYAALAGTLATLQAVSAQRFDGSRDGVLERLENKLDIGDECHSPLGSYVLSMAGQPTIPPCIAEQGISSACETLTKALVLQPGPEKDRALKAYQQCLLGPGSSYRQDVMGCLKCKFQHNKFSEAQYDWWVKKISQGLDNFARDAQPKTHAWDYSKAIINWDDLLILAKPRADIKVQAKSVAEYYPEAPEVQGLGTFVLNNRTYPEAALRDQGLLMPGKPVERIDPFGKIFDAQVKPAPAPVDAQSQPAAQHTTLVRLASDSRLPAGTSSEPPVGAGTSSLPELHAASTPKLPIFSNHTSTAAVRTQSAVNAAAAASETKMAGADDVARIAAANTYGKPSVLVLSFYQERSIVLISEGCLRFSFASVSAQVYAVAGAEPHSMSVSDAVRRGLPDISNCETCKTTISLESATRSEAVINHPAGLVGQQISAVLSDKSLPAHARWRMAEEVVENAAAVTAGASEGVALSLGHTSTVEDKSAHWEVAHEAVGNAAAVTADASKGVALSLGHTSTVEDKSAHWEVAHEAVGNAAAVTAGASEGVAFRLGHTATVEDESAHLSQKQAVVDEAEIQDHVTHKQATVNQVKTPPGSLAHQQVDVDETIIQSFAAPDQTAAGQFQAQAQNKAQVENQGFATHKHNAMSETNARGSVSHKQDAADGAMIQSIAAHGQAATSQFRSSIPHKPDAANEVKTQGSIAFKQAPINGAMTQGTAAKNQTAAAGRLQAQSHIEDQVENQGFTTHEHNAVNETKAQGSVSQKQDAADGAMIQSIATHGQAATSQFRSFITHKPDDANEVETQGSITFKQAHINGTMTQGTAAKFQTAAGRLQAQAQIKDQVETKIHGSAGQNQTAAAHFQARVQTQADDAGAQIDAPVETIEQLKDQVNLLKAEIQQLKAKAQACCDDAIANLVY